jgi:hypothetical protein
MNSKVLAKDSENASVRITSSLPHSGCSEYTNILSVYVYCVRFVCLVSFQDAASESNAAATASEKEHCERQGRC